MGKDIRERAVLRPKGRLFEDFYVGQTFNHHWGRTISESESLIFSSLTLSSNPLYLNRDYAIALGHPDMVVNPLLVFNTVLGLSVEDCSEIGGPFLGVFELVFHCQLYPGVTVTALSETIDTRLSGTNPANGIVTWRTKGVGSNGETLISFRRTNLVSRRNVGEK